MKVTAELTWGVSVCAHLRLGKMSSLGVPRLCVCARVHVAACVCVCACVFHLSAVGSCEKHSGFFTVNPQSLCPRSVGEVFFYPLL